MVAAACVKMARLLQHSTLSCCIQWHCVLADCLTKAKIPFQPAVATVFCLVDLRKALAEPTWEVSLPPGDVQLPSTGVLHLESSSVCSLLCVSLSDRTWWVRRAGNEPSMHRWLL